MITLLLDLAIILLAEEDRLSRLYPVERTPELFEKYLPYALALDAEQPWTGQFSDVLSRSALLRQRGLTRGGIRDPRGTVPALGAWPAP